MYRSNRFSDKRHPICIYTLFFIVCLSCFVSCNRPSNRPAHAVTTENSIPIGKKLTYEQFYRFLSDYLKGQSSEYRNTAMLILEKQAKFCVDGELTEPQGDLSALYFQISVRDGRYPVLYCNPNNSNGHDNTMDGMVLADNAIVALDFTMQHAIDSCPCQFHESPKFLDDEFMKTIVKISTLKSLSFTETSITSQGISTLTELQHLEQFTTYGLPIDQEVFDRFAMCKSLKSLHFNYSLFIGTSLEISSMQKLEQLAIFSLQNNDPQSAASSHHAINIRNLPALSSLHLGTGRLISPVIRIADLPIITSIYVGFSPDETRDGDACFFGLQNLPELKDLSIKQGYPSFSYDFKGLPKLLHPYIWFNKSTDEREFWKTIDSLSQSKLLEKLHLSLPPGRMLDLSPLNCFTELHELELRDDKLERRQTRTLSNLSNVKTLKLEFSNKEGTYIIENMPDLERLDLLFQQCDTFIVRNCPKFKKPAYVESNAKFSSLVAPKINHFIMSESPETDRADRPSGGSDANYTPP